LHVCAADQDLVRFNKYVRSQRQIHNSLENSNREKDILIVALSAQVEQQKEKMTDMQDTINAMTRTLAVIT
jgi:hypothetical protein